VGIRYNGQNLDLNRDGMKAETPEVQGLIQNALMRWDPVFFLDSHTHNGSYHQEPVTWVWGLNPNGDPAILSYMSDVLLPYVTERMREEYGTLTIPHGDFVNAAEPETGWIPLGPEPRYLSNYVGLRNRISILNEQYPYVSFETRVRGAYDLFLTFLDFLHANKDEVVELVRNADRRTVARGTNPSPDDGFIVEYDTLAIDQTLTIEGYEMELVEGRGGRMRARPTDVTRTYENVPFLANFIGKRTVPFPRGYLIAIPDDRVLAALQRHGIVVERLTEPATLTVESFSVTEVSGSRRLNQGHYTTSVGGEYSTVEKEFPRGALFVPTAQALGSLAAFLLEPESGDGLVYWNFFDRYLQAQWSNAAQTYPVYKLMTPANFVTEPVRN
jgi:hypothetical protein